LDAGGRLLLPGLSPPPVAEDMLLPFVATLLLPAGTDCRLLGGSGSRVAGAWCLRDGCASCFLTPSSALPRNSVPDEVAETEDRLDDTFDIDGRLGNLATAGFVDNFVGDGLDCDSADGALEEGRDRVEVAAKFFGEYRLEGVGDNLGEDLVEFAGDTFGEGLGDGAGDTL